MIQFPTLDHLTAAKGSGIADGIEVVHLETSSTPHLRRPPLFVHDPHATHLGDRIKLPAKIARQPVFCIRVLDATLTGYRAVIGRAGALVLDRKFNQHECDTQLHRLSREDSALHHEDSGIRQHGSGYKLCKELSQTVEIDASVVSLGSVEPANYGSWIFRVLPKLALAREMGLQHYPVICYAPRQWQMELLSKAGVPAENVIQLQPWRSYRIRELYIPSASNPEAFLDERTVSFYETMFSELGIERKRQQYLYLSRRNIAMSREHNNTRSFVNEQEVTQALQRNGFSIIEPETLSIDEQIRIFSQAAMIAGPSGSAMFNCAFAQPGTAVVDIETSKNWLHAHTNFFSSCGHAYALAFGLADLTDPSPVHKRWSIDAESLVDKINRFRDAL